MIRIWFFLYLTLCTAGILYAQEKEDTIVILKLFYNGKNLYVIDPCLQPGVFCTKQVLVNDSSITCKLNADAYEIPLADLHLPTGTPLVVRVVHRAGCEPRLLTQGRLTNYNGPASPNFNVKQISLPSANQLSFLVEGSPGNRTMIVQHRMADSIWWVSLDTLYSVADSKSIAYTVTLTENASPGENFRIKMLTKDQEKPVYSYRYIYQPETSRNRSGRKRKTIRL